MQTRPHHRQYYRERPQNARQGDANTLCFEAQERPRIPECSYSGIEVQSYVLAGVLPTYGTGRWWGFV